MLSKYTRLEEGQYLGPSREVLETAADHYLEEMRDILSLIDSKDPILRRQLNSGDPVEEEWAIQKTIRKSLEEEGVDPKTLDEKEWAFHQATIRRAITKVMAEMASPNLGAQLSDPQPSLPRLRVVRP